MHIQEKKCGINKITLFDATNYKTSLDAEVKEYANINSGYQCNH